MSARPLTFQFKRNDGTEVTIKASGFCPAEPSVGIRNPYFEEIEAENENGEPVELTKSETDDAAWEATQIVLEPDCEGGGDGPDD